MTQQFTTTDLPVEVIKQSFGTPLQSFTTKTQGIWVHRKELFGTLILIGIFGWSVFSTFQSITYLGWEYYFQQRKSDLFWTIIFIGFIIYRILHLKNVLSTSAEIFANGFYLQHGKKQYAYAFTDIAHLQKAFFRGGNNQINSIRLTFYLNSGEVVTIQESWTELLVRFADALTLAYVEHKKAAVLEQFKKGERIWFWLLELDKHTLYYDGKELPRNDISEIKEARSDRYLLVNDLQDKKLAKRDLNEIRDEDLFLILLSGAGKYPL